MVDDPRTDPESEADDPPPGTDSSGGDADDPPTDADDPPTDADDPPTDADDPPTDADHPDTDPDRSLAETLAALADREEFEVDTSRWGVELASDRVSVGTPAGWLSFQVPAQEDYGAEHERHDPDEDVYVDMWFLEGYTVVHTQDGRTGEATHTLEVHEQRPEERALELQAHGVPERRAEVAALRERGLTYSEIVEATGNQGPNHRGDVSKHLQKYHEQIHDARWLAEHARPPSLGRSAGRAAADEDGSGGDGPPDGSGGDA